METMNNTSSNPICYTNTMYYQTKLLKILDDANVSHDLYKKIIEWVIDTIYKYTYIYILKS